MELELNWKKMELTPTLANGNQEKSTGMFGYPMAIYHIMLQFIQNHSRFVKMLIKTCMISLKASTFNTLELLCEMCIFVVIQIFWSLRKYIEQ